MSAPAERDLTPRANRILAEPATVAACRADYQASAHVRQAMSQQFVQRHRKL